MIEKFIDIMHNFVIYIIELLDTPFFFLKPIDVLFMVALGFGIYFFVKHSVKAFFKYSAKGVVAISKPLKALYIKNKKARENKVLCHVCRNPLIKCTCKSNQDVPYKERLKKWKVKEAALHVAQTEKAKEISKPIELKKKSVGGK